MADAGAADDGEGEVDEEEEEDEEDEEKPSFRVSSVPRKASAGRSKRPKPSELPSSPRVSFGHGG